MTLRVEDNHGRASYLTRNVAPIDVKPGSADNPINLKSNGVTPIAILSTSGFDATTLDGTTLRIGPGGATIKNGPHIEDVNRDGQLSGTLTTGVQFWGTDRVRVLK